MYKNNEDSNTHANNQRNGLQMAIKSIHDTFLKKIILECFCIYAKRLSVRRVFCQNMKNLLQILT